jgi:hypothetical protein
MRRMNGVPGFYGAISLWGDLLYANHNISRISDVDRPDIFWNEEKKKALLEDLFFGFYASFGV